jgi:hypothetical protein
MAPKKKPTSSSPAKKKKQRASKKPRAKAADEGSPVLGQVSCRQGSCLHARHQGSILTLEIH